MKRMTRIMVSALLGVSMIVTLAACGGSGSTAPATTEETTTAEVHYTTEQVWFTNGDKQIYGTIYRPDTEAATYPTIICSHGFGGSGENNCGDYAAAYANAGYLAVTFDFCGGGPSSQSDGIMTEMSVLTESSDLQAVIASVKALEYVDKDNFFLMGESQGGYVTAYTAAQIPDEIKNIILFYPAFALQDDCWERHGSVDNIPETEEVMGQTIGAIYSQDAMSFDIYEVIGNFKNDVLIIHGTADTIVDISYSEKAVTVYENATLLTYDGASHGFYSEYKQQAIADSLEFLDAHKG